MDVRLSATDRERKLKSTKGQNNTLLGLFMKFADKKPA